MVTNNLDGDRDWLMLACNFEGCPYETNLLPKAAAVAQLESHILSHKFMGLDPEFLRKIENYSRGNRPRSVLGWVKDSTVELIPGAVAIAIAIATFNFVRDAL